MARPSKYKPEYDEQAKKLCLLGATDAQLADFFGVTEQTVNNWKTSHPGFFESLKKGKVVADVNVAQSLYTKATGYDRIETRTYQAKDGPKSVEVEAHYPPDTTAAIFWLKNRQPENWRDKREYDATITGESTGLFFSDGSEAE